MLYQVIRVNNSFVVEDDQDVPLKYSYATKAIAEYVAKNATAKNAKLLRPQGQDKVFCVSEIRPPVSKKAEVVEWVESKPEVKTDNATEVDIYAIAAKIRTRLPESADVRREGTWLWVYQIAKDDKDSHTILKANGLTFAKGRSKELGYGVWCLKPNGKVRKWKGYRAKVNTNYEVEVLS
jgi:hypothetical protein